MKIEVSGETFKRLQSHAVPLTDTVENVLVRLLDAYEGRTTARAKDVNLDDLLPPHMRPKRRISGFGQELWEMVILKLPEEFSLADVYRHLTPLRKARPHVKELEASTRAALQALRDAGYIDFLDNRGQYRRRAS